eukprot:SAG11_NODE_13202_length_665_cov_6.595406_1_plen_90_part_10
MSYGGSWCWLGSVSDVPCCAPYSGRYGGAGLVVSPAPPYEALDFSDDSDSLEDSSPPCDSSHIARPIVLPLLMCTLALLIVNLVSSLHYE